MVDYKADCHHRQHGRKYDCHNRQHPMIIRLDLDRTDPQRKNSDTAVRLRELNSCASRLNDATQNITFSTNIWRQCGYSVGRQPMKLPSQVSAA